MRVGLLLALLLFLMDRAAIGRPQLEQQLDWTLIESQALPLKMTENDDNRIKIPTISKFDSLSNFKKQLMTRELSPELKQKSKQTFESLIPDGPPVELSIPELKSKSKQTFESLISDDPSLELSNPEIKDEKKEKSHRHRLSEWFNDPNELNSDEGCLTSPYSQVVHMKGCESKFVLNRFCHGKCSSIYFPQMRSRKLKAIFENYKVCRPAEVEHVLVKLECENGTIIREIPRIKRCACIESDAPLPD